MMQKVKTQGPLREVVHSELKHMILTGLLEPNARLIETDLAAQLNVSRTPIREAIQLLADEGLCVIVPRRGAFVSMISSKDMEDLFLVRAELEGFAAALSAKKVTEEQKQYMAKLVRLFEIAIQKGDIDEIVEYDEQFHNYTVKCCDNKPLITMIRDLQDRSMRFRYLLYGSAAAYGRMVDEHRAIMEAIANGDAADARSKVEKHIMDLHEYLVEFRKEKAITK